MSFENRMNKVLNQLTSENLDGAYITNLTNVRYLTGFTDSAGSVLILNEDKFSKDNYSTQALSNN